MPTNREALAQLMRETKHCDEIFNAILRERILHISKMTRASIEEEPDKWNNAFIHHSKYIEFCNIVDDILKFE